MNDGMRSLASNSGRSIHRRFDFGAVVLSISAGRFRALLPLLFSSTGKTAVSLAEVGCHGDKVLRLPSEAVIALPLGCFRGISSLGTDLLGKCKNSCQRVDTHSYRSSN